MATFEPGGATIATASGTKATASFTPAVGDLIVAVIFHTGNTAFGAPTDDNADGLGTYTLAVEALKNTSADKLSIYVRDAFVGSATGTIITTAPGATSGGGVRGILVTGLPTGRVGSAAVRQVGKEENQAAATPAPSFPGAALTANACIGAIFNATNVAGLTPPSGWGEGSGQGGIDQGYNTPTTGIEIATIESGETGTTITWGSASASAFCSAILELDTSAVSTTADPYPYVAGGYYPTEG